MFCFHLNSGIETFAFDLSAFSFVPFVFGGLDSGLFWGSFKAAAGQNVLLSVCD